MGFVAKGVPAHGVAAFYGPPDDIVLLVATKSGIKTVADVKGKRIGCTTPGSLTDWLIKQLSVQQKWGESGITSVPLGEAKAEFAALERGEIDGIMGSVENGAQHQLEGQGSVLISGGAIVHDFITHIIFARDDYTKSNPELVKKFIDAWFKTVAYMRTHRAETIAIGAKVEGLDPKAEAIAYDTCMKSMLSNGNFSQKALDRLAKSWVELGILPSAPNPIRWSRRSSSRSSPNSGDFAPGGEPRFERAQQIGQHDAGQRQRHDRDEQRRHIEDAAGGRDDVAEAGLRAEQLADDDADQPAPDRQPHSRDDERRGRRDRDGGEDARGARAERARDGQQAAVGRFETGLRC